MNAADTFLNDHFFHYLWLVPILIAGLIYSRRREISLFSRFSGNWKKIVFHRYSKTYAIIRNTSLLLCFVLLVVSLARPRLGFKWQEKPTGGIDLLIAVDISKSMFATDLKPNRLERAKREILDLLKLLQGDRVGFLPFSGKSFIHLPLTDDYKMAKLFLENIDNDLISIGGTNISEALDLGVKSLTKSAAYNSEGKAIILITDGEDHSGKLFESAQKAKEKGIRVFVVGIGSPEGAPLELPDGSYLKDSSGSVVISKLAEADLVKVAEDTGGIYVRSVAGDIDLEKIYIEGIKPSSQSNAYGDARQKIWNEIYQWPLLGALFFLVVSFLLTPYRKLANTAVLLAALSFSVSKSEASILTPENSDFAQGVKFFKDGNIEESIKSFTKQMTSGDKKLSHASLFNLGNAYVSKGELETALEYYKKAYTVNDNHQPTIENMKWVHDQLDQNKQNQDQQNQDQKNQDQKNQDQKNQDQKNQDQKNQDQKNQDQKNQDQKNQDQKNQDQQNQDQKNQDQQSENNKEKSDDKLSEEELEKKKKEQSSASNDSDKKDKSNKEKKEKKGLEESEQEESEKKKMARQGKDRKEESEEEQIEKVEKEQAVGLFRNLEENLKAYGRRPNFKKNNNPGNKDW